MILRAASFALAIVVAAQVAHGAFEPGHALIEALLFAPVVLLALLLARRTGPFAVPVTALLVTGALVPGAVLHAAFMPGAHHVEQFRHAATEALTLLPVTVVAAALALWMPRARLPRRSLALGMAVVAALATINVAPAGATHTPFSAPLTIPPELTGSDIAIDMRAADVQIMPGAPTRMWTYSGIFPGPTIRRPSGQQTRVTFTNNLPGEAQGRHMPEATVHHHGNHSAASEDGPPAHELIPVGGSRTYTYDFLEDGAPERGAFQWYHDHRMDVTGRNVWMGLAGMVILDDPVEQSLDLPAGAFDVPLMFADRSFDVNNQLSYTFDPNGLLGNHTLVNGKPQPYFEVGDRKYRLRLLNASNLRSYEFTLDKPIPMMQIATESGLLPAPVQRSRIRLGPGERAEIVLDFAGRLGETVLLRNINAIPQQQQVMQFRVTQDLLDDSALPPVLRPLPELEMDPVSLTRTWVLGAEPDPLVWTINGRRFDPERVDTAPLNPVLNSTERWVFVNATTAEHIVHIHDVDWRLVRRIGPTQMSAEELAVEQNSLKETFVIRPGETIELISKFTDHVGRYVFHCHLLEHEDRSMMANFEVVPTRL